MSPQAPTGNAGVADAGGRESAGVLSPAAAVAGGRESASLTPVASDDAAPAGVSPQAANALAGVSPQDAKSSRDVPGGRESAGDPNVAGEGDSAGVTGGGSLLTPVSAATRHLSSLSPGAWPRGGPTYENKTHNAENYYDTEGFIFRGPHGSCGSGSSYVVFNYGVWIRRCPTDDLIKYESQVFSRWRCLDVLVYSVPWWRCHITSLIHGMMITLCTSRTECPDECRLSADGADISTTCATIACEPHAGDACGVQFEFIGAVGLCVWPAPAGPHMAVNNLEVDCDGHRITSPLTTGLNSQEEDVPLRVSTGAFSPRPPEGVKCLRRDLRVRFVLAGAMIQDDAQRHSSGSCGSSHRETQINSLVLDVCAHARIGGSAQGPGPPERSSSELCRGSCYARRPNGRAHMLWNLLVARSLHLVGDCVDTSVACSWTSYAIYRLVHVLLMDDYDDDGIVYSTTSDELQRIVGHTLMLRRATSWTT